MVFLAMAIVLVFLVPDKNLLYNCNPLLLITRAKARVINSLRCFFFAQDLVSHAANLDFDQSLQIVDACDYLRLCYWQFSSRISSSSHSTSCYSRALQVNSALKFVLYHSNTFNVRLLGMRAQNKPLYAFQACIFDENSHTRSAQINEAAILYAF